MPSLTFQTENAKRFLEDGKQIFPQHWRELALDQDEIPYDLDVARYLQLDQLGMLLIVGVRDGDRLVGYAVMFLSPHFHYRSSGLMAMADMYYLLPEYRKGVIGLQLFTALERELKARGVTRAHIGCKVHQDHEKLFERLGWRFTDKTFSKLLKGQ